MPYIFQGVYNKEKKMHGKFNIEVQSVDRFNLNNLYLKTPRGQGARSPHKRLCMAEEISNA
jgi:hypothetical protein